MSKVVNFVGDKKDLKMLWKLLRKKFYNKYYEFVCKEKS